MAKNMPFCMYDDCCSMLRASAINIDNTTLIWNKTSYPGDLVISIPTCGEFNSLTELKTYLINETNKTIALLSNNNPSQSEIDSSSPDLDLSEGVDIKTIFSDCMLSATYTEGNWKDMLKYGMLKEARLWLIIDTEMLKEAQSPKMSHKSQDFSAEFNPKHMSMSFHSGSSQH